MNKIGILIGAACICGVAVFAKCVNIPEKLFSGKYEDTYLKAVKTGRLIGDRATWPVNLIRPLLP